MGNQSEDDSNARSLEDKKEDKDATYPQSIKRAATVT